MKRISLLFILLATPMALFAQGKALTFAQIAFGGGYETVLNVTNRGTAAFNGTLTVTPTDRSRPFPVMVNGNPASGPVSVTLDPGATATLTITSGDASLGVLTGFGGIASTNPEAASLLEGNLTYYVKSANGVVVDSTGVGASVPFRQTVIPFDDFQAIAFALANTSGQTATVTLNLFDDKNAHVSATTQRLENNQQIPRFLSQFFPGVSLTKGRVEIGSDRNVFGTALTFAKSGQASSLPLLPSIKLYEGRFSIEGVTFIGYAYVSGIGNTITGYFVDTENGVPIPPLEPFVGLVENGTLRILERESSDGISELVIPGYNPSAATLSGTLVIYRTNPPGGVIVQGTLTLTALN